MELGQRILEMAKKRGITQVQLSNSLNISQASISQWKRGSSPHPNKLPAIAAALGVSVAELLGEVPAAPPADASTVEKLIAVVSSQQETIKMLVSAQNVKNVKEL